MSLRKITPEKRTALLSEPGRRRTFLDFLARYGKATAERYLAVCAKAPGRRKSIPNPHTKRLAIVLCLLGAQSLIGCASVIGDYGPGGLTGESRGTGITPDDLVGAIGGLFKAESGQQVYESSQQLPPERQGVREVHGSVDREGCRRMEKRFRAEGRNVRLVDIVDNYLANPGQRNFNYMCIFEGSGSEPGYYGNYPTQYKEP